MPRRKGSEAGESFEPGRCFAFFGPAGCGAGTILRALHEESETKTAFVEAGDAILSKVETARKNSAEVVLLDGLPVGENDVQWLYDERLVAPGWGGGIIRVDRHAVVDHEFSARLVAIEARIRDLSMPYFVVRNDDPERAAVDIACRIGLWR